MGCRMLFLTYDLEILNGNRQMKPKLQYPKIIIVPVNNSNINNIKVRGLTVIWVYFRLKNFHDKNVSVTQQ